MSSLQSLGSKLTHATEKVVTDAIKLPMGRIIPKVPPNEHFYLRIGEKNYLEVLLRSASLKSERTKAQIKNSP